MASAASNYNKTLVNIQKLANSSAKTIQSMINKSNQQQMTFNSGEAQKSRDWQEEMSKKAHQMEVEDLKKAGLNPVLSAGGSGAQSYTTSSASTTNDSGSSAVGAMLSSELGAMSNMESARMSADAQLKASQQQAKATRFAAQQSAAATKYAASASAAAAKYQADIKYKANKENIQQSKWKTKNQTANTWAGMLDKALRNYGIYKSIGKMGRANLNFAFGEKSKKLITKNKSSFFDSSGKLTTKGYQNGVEALQSCNIVANRKNVNLYYSAVMNHNKKALEYLIKQTPEYMYSKGSNGKVKIDPFSVRPGYR